jgi:transposase-like protein
VPKKEHKEAAERIRAIYLAETREAAARLAQGLINEWEQVGYLKAASCPKLALERLLTFHAFPTEHARHLRTTNPIESPFASVKLRTNAARRFRTPIRPCIFFSNCSSGPKKAGKDSASRRN